MVIIDSIIGQAARADEYQIISWNCGETANLTTRQAFRQQRSTDGRGRSIVNTLNEDPDPIVLTPSADAPIADIAAQMAKEAKQRRRKETKAAARAANPQLRADQALATAKKKYLRQYKIATHIIVRCPIDYMSSFQGEMQSAATIVDFERGALARSGRTYSFDVW